MKIDDLISMERDGATSYYHYDGLGSVRQLTDATQVVSATYSYDAFGSVRNQAGTVNNPYLFTARRLDAESGLYFYRARYYDAVVGRFISKDPILQGAGINLDCYSCGIGSNLGFMISTLVMYPQRLNGYVYVENNPVNIIDPTGLSSCEAIKADCLKAARNAALQCHMEVVAEAVKMYGACLLACAPAGSQTLKLVDVCC